MPLRLIVHLGVTGKLMLRLVPTLRSLPTFCRELRVISVFGSNTDTCCIVLFAEAKFRPILIETFLDLLYRSSILLLKTGIRFALPVYSKLGFGRVTNGLRL